MPGFHKIPDQAGNDGGGGCHSRESGNLFVLPASMGFPIKLGMTIFHSSSSRA